MSADALRLLAQDADDLKIVSAAAQDAVLRLGDVQYSAREHAFTVAMNRYRWEAEKGSPERVRSALRFDGVLSVKSHNVRQNAPEAVVNLLAVEFEPADEAGEDPGGRVRLILSGGAEIALQTECLEARLMDVSDPWPARSRPDHDKD